MCTYKTKSIYTYIKDLLVLGTFNRYNTAQEEFSRKEVRTIKSSEIYSRGQI